MDRYFEAMFTTDGFEGIPTPNEAVASGYGLFQCDCCGRYRGGDGAHMCPERPLGQARFQEPVVLVSSQPAGFVADLIQRGTPVDLLQDPVFQGDQFDVGLFSRQLNETSNEPVNEPNPVSDTHTITPVDIEPMRRVQRQGLYKHLDTSTPVQFTQPTRAHSLSGDDPCAPVTFGIGLEIDFPNDDPTYDCDCDCDDIDCGCSGVYSSRNEVASVLARVTSIVFNHLPVEAQH
jgi:hypothetical protein